MNQLEMTVIPAEPGLTLVILEDGDRFFAPVIAWQVWDDDEPPIPVTTDGRRGPSCESLRFVGRRGESGVEYWGLDYTAEGWSESELLAFWHARAPALRQRKHHRSRAHDRVEG